MKFEQIRNAYRSNLQSIIHDSKEGYAICPYFYDWEFTPIEWSIWQDIRAYGLPMLPQYPVLNFFIDFADPVKKIGIECDGAKWHDADKDRKRDLKLSDEGWIIYRIPGRICNKILPEPWEDKSYAEEWFKNTGSGIIYSIYQFHYNNLKSNTAIKFFNHLIDTLDMRRSL
jgi:hypothetical protein